MATTPPLVQPGPPPAANPADRLDHTSGTRAGLDLTAHSNPRTSTETTATALASTVTQGTPTTDDPDPETLPPPATDAADHAHPITIVDSDDDITHLLRPTP